jgi:hypothetical protein
MPDLRTLQRSFWSALTAPEASAHDHHRLRSVIRGDARGSARGRLQVYASMYLSRLLENLASDYPRLAAVLGPRDFDRLVTAYLHAHPSRDPSVRHLGHALPLFLRTHARNRPWLADLAALEWARLSVFDRADQPVLTQTALCDAASRGFAGLRLQAIAAHARVAVAHDVTELWRQPDQGAERSAVPRANCTLLVWRQPDGLVHHRLVPDDEAGLLVALARGLDFAALCERMCEGESEEHAARRALALVCAWTAAGLLAAT